jgi:putative NADPH-quinone reductase
VIIQGHPDPAGGHLCHALADAYAAGAQAAGHAMTRIDVAAPEFPWLRTKEAFETGEPPAALVPCQEAIAQADHLLVVYPLWLDTMPALLKAFFEQVFRPGFAFALGGTAWSRPLKGKSARIVVTMGMPALIIKLAGGAAPDLEGAFAAMIKEGAEALLVLEVPVPFTHRDRIAELAAVDRLPTMFPGGQAGSGGLIILALPTRGQ